MPEGAPILETKKFSVEKEKIPIAGTQVETIDIRPDKLKTKVPVLLAPGWGTPIPVFEPGLKVLAGHSRRALSLTHPRWGGLDKSFEEELENHPEVELLKAQNLIGLRNLKASKEQTS